MRWKTFLTLLLMALTAVVPSAYSAAATLHNEIGRYEVLPPDTDPISGEWNVTFHVHDSTTPGTFTLKLDGDKVTGTAESAHTGPGTVRDGSWKENKLSFTLDFKKHQSIAITGSLKDGKLSGEFSTEGFTDKWEAIRKGTQTQAMPSTQHYFVKLAERSRVAKGIERAGLFDTLCRADEGAPGHSRQS
jgi:hypothetical protein